MLFRLLCSESPGTALAAVMPSAKYLIGSLAAFVGLVFVFVGTTHSRITSAAAPPVNPFALPIKQLPVITSACAGKLNNGDWTVPEGMPSSLLKV